MRSEESHVHDRGAVLVHVALALLALVAFTTFVVDYGVLWAARRQAQNAADAGALAGAMGYAADPLLDKTASGDAQVNALSLTQSNLVWGAAPSVIPNTDITFPTCPDGEPDGCIKVDVHRTNARGNPLPMFFGPLVGLTQQDIKATATAQIIAGNAAECLKPWAIPDKWAEADGTKWDITDTFDRYDSKGNLLSPADTYAPPTKSPPSAGTGFTVKDDYGTQLTLKHGNPQDAINPGWFFPVIVDPTCSATGPSTTNCGGGGSGAGGCCYRNAIAGCAPLTWAIGDEIETEPGNMVGPTNQGMQDLIDLDPGAKWDSTLKDVIDSCVDLGTCPQYTQSPRIVPVPLFDPDDYQVGKTQGRTTVKIVNILGFFVEQVTGGGDVTGYLMTQPGMLMAGKGQVGWQSAFSRVFILVR